MKKFDIGKQSRRDILRSLGGAAAATLLGCGTSKIVTTGSSSGTSTTSASSGTSSESSTTACLVESSTTRGPYFVDTVNDTNNVATSGTPYTIDALIPQRSDIRADTEGSAGTQQGVPLVLNITLYDSSCSSVVSGARVDIWHANAHGAYSDIKNAGNDGGADHTGQNFLRGYQFSDSNGLVTFTTVYPGAYSGRCPHIHLKIRIFNASGVVTTENTTQLFFTDTTSSSVYTASSYYSTSGYNTKDSADQIYNSESPALIPSLRRCYERSHRDHSYWSGCGQNLRRQLAAIGPLPNHRHQSSSPPLTRRSVTCLALSACSSGARFHRVLSRVTPTTMASRSTTTKITGPLKTISISQD